MKTIPAFLILVLSVFAVLAQNTPVSLPVNVEDVYLAKDDGKGNAGEIVSGFLTTDIPIYCVVQLNSNMPVTVKMNFVAAKVPGVRPETKVVSTSYTTKQGETRVNFSGRPAGKWVAGTYRADVFIDGNPVKNLSFEIIAPKTNVAGATPFVSKSNPKPKTVLKQIKN